MAKETEQPTITLPAIVQPDPSNTEPRPLTPIPANVQVDSTMNLAKVYDKDELVLHNKDGDLWLAIDGTVYDLTKFSEEHPGGQKILLSVAGTDASKKYRKYHGDNILQRYAKEYKIGTLRINEPNREQKGLLALFRRKK
ncbi:cytochrome b5-like heme/steroid binding domain-containing protein [Aspergillus venezuelensis]